MSRSRTRPTPAIGTIVTYTGLGRTLRRDSSVRVVAECSGRRFAIDCVTHEGKVARRYVHADHLVPRAADLLAPLDGKEAL